MINEIKKPSDWPINAKECALENISNALQGFIDYPGYKTKEILVSLVSQYDLNQKSYLGLFRITEYEVAMINSLYMYGSLVNIKSLTTYLYGIVGDTIQMQKGLSRIKYNNTCGDEAYQQLLASVKISSQFQSSERYVRRLCRAIPAGIAR